MPRLKIDYGIDLGTTNSAICRMDQGKPTIIKTDVLKDTMPSCVSVNRRGGVMVGESAFSTMQSDKLQATKSLRMGSTNTYVEFKRTMGTDTKYHSENAGRDFSSEELSAEVLKTLKSFVTDENFSSVVITVPAKFTVNQKTATLEAARLAGFKKCELLQEPIAAAMAYGLKTEQKDGIWMVFDFGGGTFDAALLRVEDGIQTVFDTEGDNYLGGKNLDYAIVDEIIIPFLQENYTIDEILEDEGKRQVLRDAMKIFAEKAKNSLSFKETYEILSDLGEILCRDDEGEEIELDMSVSQAELFDVMRPIFQKAVDICKTLIERNNIPANKLSKVILVGGPTHSPLIRQMLREQITPKVDTSIDPMTAVAVGAALYASTIDAEVREDIKEGTVELDIQYDSTTVENSTFVAVKLPDNAAREKVWVELRSSDKSWSSAKTAVDKVGDVIEVNLAPSKPNAFSVLVYDEHGNSLDAFPAEITIIQGTKVGAAPLPYNIGIATWSDVKKCAVFRMAKGLEKNKPVPAVGVVNDLKTTSQLRPGNDEDKLVVPVYQTDDFAAAEGRPAMLFEHVGDVHVTGGDVGECIPTGSPVDITLKVDSSEQMTLEVHFLSSDDTVELTLDTTKKHSTEDAKQQVQEGLKDAKRSLDRLSGAGIDVSDLQEKLDRVEEEAENNSEPKATLQHLKEVLRDIDALDASTEWQRLEKDLRERFDDLEQSQKRNGNEKSEQMINQLRRQIDEVIRKKDVSMGREVLDQVISLFVQLNLLEMCIGCILEWNNRFGSIRWSDRTRARQLINRGIEVVNDQPTTNTLLPIVRNIAALLPPDDRGGIPENLLS